MRLLIIGELEGQLIPASRIAQENGAKVTHCIDQISALNVLRSGRQFDLVFMDVNEGIPSFIDKLTKEKFVLEIIACGIKCTKSEVLEAIKAGAKEYLPLPPQHDLIAAIFESIAGFHDRDEIIGNALKFSQSLEMARKVAGSEATVLISGESGTGKEVFAKFLHGKSARAKMEFLSINCAAIPENLMESELFGHEKGAFTGAVDRRIGKFEAANNSTLLLDEISEMDLKLQAKLLRVLQEKKITRLGSNKEVPVNVRIIATTNRDLYEYVKQGGFREDLYYRLNVVNIKLPALRERVEDIVDLANYFVSKYSALNGLKVKGLSKEAISTLISYNWPGNIRELENTIHRAVLLSSSEEIVQDDIMLINQASPSVESPRSLADMEKEAIINALSSSSGDEVKAAMLLGISCKQLQQKLNKLKVKAA